ncbi:MAG TPA: LodA/GoxA family CTQ-dependent oxidase, partial [Dyella sp.]|uniref:LodA/GoxA family CTQ-dependent oxidase n=1 Tax=Dyella sp. TaxID=1869338 RepID=UPI002CD9B942
GPENMEPFGVELGPTGENPVIEFKDQDYRMKRQGARFRIFELHENGIPTLASFPAGTTVRWTVRLANKKDAVHRPSYPPTQPEPVRDDPARQNRIIEATGDIAGMSQPAVVLKGAYLNEPVILGEILTDKNQHLIVLGGSGRSGTLTTPPAPMGDSFYNNPDWFDDVADGSVSATVEIPGQEPVTAHAAWIITAPPDFAPLAQGVVTLFDVIKQVAINKGWIAPKPRPSFETDIKPMIQRAAQLRWVERGAVWPLISQDWANLSNSSAAHAPLRTETAILVREVEVALSGFELQEWQLDALDAWVAGNFDIAESANRGLCDALTRAALDTTVGQGFFPGIEAGINMTDPNLYDSAPFEFRFNPAALRPGDVTAHMAQPWQADFLKCADGWWPAQRPNLLLTKDGSKVRWLRPKMTHLELVGNVMKLGVATPDENGNMFEQGRDPALT